MRDLPSGTVTFSFTDIEGSTRLLSELGEAYVTALAEHRRILREAFARHSGVEVGTGGRCLLRLRGARGFRGPRAGFRGFPPTADRRLRRRAGPQYEREDRFS